MINAVKFIKSYENKSGGKIYPLSKENNGVLVSDSYFSSIAQKKSGVLYAIDGGSSIIADGGGWIIALIRTAVVGYEDHKRIFEEKKDYTLTVVNAESYNYLLEDSFGHPVAIKIPNLNNEEIEDVPAIIMKLLEWNMCLVLTKKKDCIIVMDSSLESENIEESRLISEASKTNSRIIGFSKTSRLRTNTGRSLLGYLNNRCRDEWSYYPVFKDEKLVKTCICKFNKRSKFSNKVQHFSKEANIHELFSMLSYFSDDSEMLGYPYPLIRADKIARITGYEKKKASAVINRVLKSEGLDVDTYSQSEHSELDMRMYRNINQKS